MKNETISKFKNVLHKGMIENFKTDGSLTPIMFFMKDDQPIITQIPNEYLINAESKNKLGEIVRKLTQEPDTKVAGIIIEAYGAKIDNKKDPKTAKSLINGDVRVSELDERQDIIVMIFSTPYNEEMISYVVDPKTKTVGESFNDNNDADAFMGTFSHFFNWTNN